jgi:DNA-binding PadR family transcriptional regulator
VMDRTSLYRALTPMQRAGWLAVEDGPGGGRAKTVALTDAGRDLVAAAAPAWEAAQRRVVEAFGVDRWAELQGSIAALTDAGVAAGPRGDGA